MIIKNIISKAFNTFLILLIVSLSMKGFAQEFEPNTLIVKLKKENANLFNNKASFQIKGIDITNIKPILRNSKKSNC